MKGRILNLTYEVEVSAGEAFTLPDGVAESIPPGRWRITIRPASERATRGHGAFLNAYAAGDEGLYDDLPPS